MGDYTHWHVGMKLVCLKDGGWQLVSGPKRREVLPLKGGIYSISYIEAEDELVFIALAECEPTALFLAEKNYTPDFPGWMKRLPPSIRSFMARRWRRSATRLAALAERRIADAYRLRDEARRYEAAANWIEGE